MNRRRFAALTGGVVLCSAVPSMPASKNRLEEELTWVSVPGAATARIDRGRIRGDAGGVLLAGTSRAVTENSIFEAASLSKPLFAYAVYEQLIAPKKIDLDRPLNDYLPRPHPSDDPRTERSLVTINDRDGVRHVRATFARVFATSDDAATR